MNELIKKHLDAFTAGNWPEFRSMLASNVVLDEVPTRQTVLGADDYVALVQRWKTAFPDLRPQIKDVVGTDDRVVIELEWEGTQRAPLQAPFGSIPATNKQARIPAVLIMKIEGNKIRACRHYFDMFSLMTQLGLAPTFQNPSVGGGTSHAQPSTRT